MSDLMLAARLRSPGALLAVEKGPGPAPAPGLALEMLRGKECDPVPLVILPWEGA